MWIFHLPCILYVVFYCLENKIKLIIVLAWDFSNTLHVSHMSIRVHYHVIYTVNSRTNYIQLRLLPVVDSQ